MAKGKKAGPEQPASTNPMFNGEPGRYEQPEAVELPAPLVELREPAITEQSVQAEVDIESVKQQQLDDEDFSFSLPPQVSIEGMTGEQVNRYAMRRFGRRPAGETVEQQREVVSEWVRAGRVTSGSRYPG